MSVIESLYNVTFDVKRSSLVSGSRQSKFETISSGSRGVFRPVEDKEKLYNEGSMGKEFNLFCDSMVDIQANDNLEIDSITYGVIGIQLFQDLVGGNETHKEIRVSRKVQ